MGRWDNKICVILLNWNGKTDTIECLNSLRKCSYGKFTAIVVDNGSTDGSIQAIRAAHPSVPIFETRANLGFAGGNNVGIEWALRKPFDWILLLNNDTLVEAGFLEAFLEAAKEHSEAKIFGAKILRYGDRNRIDHLGGMWNSVIGEFESLHMGENDREIEGREVDYVCGAALFMHRSVPEAIGLLESKFFLFWEETDYCFRARRKGFHVRTAPHARVWHKVSASFTGGKPHSHYFWWRSRLLWLERNLPFAERQELLKRLVYPEIRKTLRHLFLKSIQQMFRPSDLVLRQKTKRLKAGLIGALDYYRGKFGNCPSWLVK
jgi:hypothetical protein